MGAMVNVLFAFVATVVALVGTGLLISRAAGDRRSHLVAWSVTLLGLSLGLGALTTGFAAAFGPALFRGVELGAALLAPLWLALGVVELVARHVQVRFGGWLVVASYSTVAVVIVLLDPVTGKFGKTLPKPDAHYTWLPLTLIAGAHLIAVITLVGCAAVTALRARDRDPEAVDILIPVALVALAGVLVVSGTRGYLPGPAAVLALGLAAGLIGFGALRMLPETSPENGEDGEYPDDGYDGYDGHHGRYDDRFDARHDGHEGAGRYGAAPPQQRRSEAFGRYAGEPEPTGHAGEPGSAGFATTRGPDGRYGQAVPPQPAQPMPSRVGAPPGAQPAVTGREHGRITVFTLLEGREAAFDRLAADLVRAVREQEPDTLIIACHEVAKAPTQRIFYELFRDQTAFLDHERQPHVRHFTLESRPHVLATNVIDLKLNAARVVPPTAALPDESRR